MKKIPDTITLCYLEVILMPNGEVICLGKTVGWFDKLGQLLTPLEEASDGHE